MADECKDAESNVTPDPASMIELRIGNIHEGKLIEEVNKAMREGVRSLIAHWRITGKSTGSLKIDLQIKIGRLADSETLLQIGTTIKKTLPAKANTSHAVESSQGYAIVQPVGSNEDPNQLLFRANGSLVGTVDSQGLGEVK